MVNLKPMKTNQQIREEFEKKFVHKGEDGDNPAEKWDWTIMGSFPIEVLTFIIAQRSQDIEEIKRWALKVKRSNVEKENRDSKLQSIGFNEALISLLSFLDSLNK